MRNVTLQCVRNIKLSLIMMMALGIINAQSVLAQWTPGWNNFLPGNGPSIQNVSNLEVSITNTPDAVVLNSAMIDFTNPTAGTPLNYRETVSAIVWGTTNDEVYLFIEHAVRDMASVSATCYTNPILSTSLKTNSLTSGAQGLHPDVILRDHPNNPGVDYIASVVYSENGGIYLEEYEITGIVPTGPSTVVLNQISKTHLTTSTYGVGDIGAYPKIDAFVNPNNTIGLHPEMGGFVVTWETAAGLEIQAFDANSNPIYETQILLNSMNPIYFTPDVAAIVERDNTVPGGFRQFAYISSYNLNSLLFSDVTVFELDITSGNPLPISTTQLVAGTSGYSHARIDGNGMVVNPNTKWVVVTSNDCNGGLLFTNSTTPFGQYISHNPSSYPSTDGFHWQSFTVTAGFGISAGGAVDEYNPFGMASYGYNPNMAHVFMNSVNPNTSLAFGAPLPDFCVVNNAPADMSPFAYCALYDDYAGQGYSLSRSANSDYDLLAAWIDDGNGVHINIPVWEI